MAKSALFVEMIGLLRRNPGITMPELVSAFGRSQRTIYRWLKELSTELNIPVHCRSGSYYLDDNGQSPLHFLPEELLALRLGLRSAVFSDSSPLADHARSAWEKVRNATTYGTRARAGDLAGSHDVAPTVYDSHVRDAIVRELEDAVKHHRRLEVTYRSQKSGRVKAYTIDPYALTFRRHSWYLLAFSKQHDEVVQFKLIRFRSAQANGETFDLPPDFSVDDHFSDSWEVWAGGERVQVRILFSSEVAPMIAETRRHKSQRLDPQPDGSLIFEVAVSGTQEMAAWVMGYGADAEVLEPAELRESIAKQVQAMAGVYGS